MWKRLSGALIVVSVISVFATLSLDSLWLDEAYSVAMATTHSARELWNGNLDPAHPPLYYVILHWFTRAVGTSEAAVRLPSAIAFVLNIILVAVLARRLALGRPTAAFAAVLVAVAPLHVYYAQEARMYALVMTTALLFAVGLALDSWIGAIIAAASLTAGLFLDFTMIPLAAVLLAFWTIRWWNQSRRPVDLVKTVLPVVIASLLAGDVWPQVVRLLATLDRITLFAKLRAIAGVERIASEAFLLLFVLAVLFVAVTGAVLLRLSRTPSVLSRAQRWVPIAFLVLVVVSVIPRGYSVKHLISVGWPFVTILVAWLLHGSSSKGVLLPATLVISTLAAAATIATPRADWRRAVEYIDHHQRPGELVWLDPSYNDLPYNYYRPRVAATKAGVSIDRARPTISLDKGVWLVAERFGGVPPTSPSEAWLDSHLTLAESVHLWRLELRRYVARNAGQ